MTAGVFICQRGPPKPGPSIKANDKRHAPTPTIGRLRLSALRPNEHARAPITGQSRADQSRRHRRRPNRLLVKRYLSLRLRLRLALHLGLRVRLARRRRLCP